MGITCTPLPQALADDASNVGFFFDHFPLTLEEGRRTEAVGPFYYEEAAHSHGIVAVPPLFSHATSEATDSEEFDFLYPLLTYDRYGSEYRWQLIQLLSFSGGQNQGDIPKDRFTVFPFYFQQRSPDPDQNYTALLPFYGRIKQRLFRDEIFFVMFPLYGQSRKRDIVTDNYIFPFFHARRGDFLRGWQFWPLIGQETKGITTRTNGFGDIEMIGAHKKFFALWPFHFNQTVDIGTENPEWKHGTLPFYSVLRSPDRDSTTVIWPLFSWIDDREKQYREWQGPWPFVVVARGEGKTATRVWPLFGRSHNDMLESNFYLWPLYKYNRVHSDPLDRERTRILLFLYSDVNEKNTETGRVRTRTALWPLFTHRREFDGNSRLQILALVEPALPHSKSVERNWSPLWSLWRAERNPSAGSASQSLLWNLYRRETSPAAKKCSLLFGLFQYSSEAEARRFRVFYIPFGKNQTPANNVAE
jgi:hypothetical protein